MRAHWLGLLVLASTAPLAAGCARECESYGDCADDQYCNDEGACVGAVDLPEAGPQPKYGYIPPGGARVDGGVAPGTPIGGGVGAGVGTPGGGGGTMPSYGPPRCGDSCTSDYDCTSTPDDPLFGVGNFRCLSGGCIYLGCTSDQECVDGYGEWWPECDENAWPWGRCLFACNEVSDCSWGEGLYDDDNWSCDGNACHYEGCVSDYECEQYFSMSGLRCARMPYQDIPICWLGCIDDADCYAGEACYNGACGWLGCTEGNCGADAVCVTPP